MRPASSFACPRVDPSPVYAMAVTAVEVSVAPV